MTTYKKGDKLRVKSGNGTCKFASGQTVYFHSYASGDLINVVDINGNLYGRPGGWFAERFELVEPVNKELRLYKHEGVDYELPEWAKYVTKDNADATKLYAWEGKPKYKHGPYAFGYVNESGKRFTVIQPYIKPLPEGAFIVEV